MVDIVSSWKWGIGVSYYNIELALLSFSVCFICLEALMFVHVCLWLLHLLVNSQLFNLNMKMMKLQDYGIYFNIILLVEARGWLKIKQDDWPGAENCRGEGCVHEGVFTRVQQIFCEEAGVKYFGFSGPTFSLVAVDNLYVTQTWTAWGTLIASVPIKLCGISRVTVCYSFKLFYHLKI